MSSCVFRAYLKKTIVFITHDFDEAIRLADRIAIMKDGEIIQIGTPEQLVLSPATDYVREFTHDIPRAKVLSARSVMKAKSQDSYSDTTSADAPIETLVARAADMEKGTAFAVTDGSGKIIGELARETVIDLLSDTTENT